MKDLGLKRLIPIACAGALVAACGGGSDSQPSGDGDGDGDGGAGGATSGDGDARGGGLSEATVELFTTVCETQKECDNEYFAERYDSVEICVSYTVYNFEEEYDGLPGCEEATADLLDCYLEQQLCDIEAAEMACREEVDEVDEACDRFETGSSGGAGGN